MTLKLATSIACLMAALDGRVALAQELRGTVRDGASNVPIAGAVVMLLDAPGQSLGRALTNENGQYRLHVATGTDRVRIVHIGFGPREVNMPHLVSPTDTMRLDVAMIRLATLTVLPPVHVSARACGSRPDRSSAIALLEQARTVLLATVVAQEASPGAVKEYGFQRRMNGTSDRIDYQTVRVDSLAGVPKSFLATRRGGEFVRLGFLGQSDHGQDVLFAPDAETLLDDDFVNAYCFRLMSPDRARPHQLGLGFSPPDRKRDRVDIDGALWIDTLTRTLRDIEFQYVGLDPRIQRFGPGGQISFGEMPNGVVLIDRWHLRLVGSRLDTAARVTAWGIDTNGRVAFFAQESGGELARASWPTGHSWQGSLGTWRLNAVTQTGAPAAGTRLRIPGTPYGGDVDTNGLLEIRELVPGPYDPVIVDPRLATVGIEISTGVKVVAVRDSTIRTRLRIPTAEDYTIGRCEAQGRRQLGDTTLVLVRVLTRAGEPIKDAEFSVYNPEVPGERPTKQSELMQISGRTGSDGVFAICTDRLALHRTLQISVRRDGYTAVEKTLQLQEPLTIFRFELEPSSKP